jgi:hypothetical protein
VHGTEGEPVVEVFMDSRDGVVQPCLLKSTFRGECLCTFFAVQAIRVL